MRSPLLLAAVLVGSTLSGLALAAPPGGVPAPVVVAPARQPTPPNVFKTVHPSKSVEKIPVVSTHVARLAAEHDEVRADPARPIPAKLRIAKEEVLVRNQEIGQTRIAVHNEANQLEQTADNQAAMKPSGQYSWSGRQNVPIMRNANAEELGQASESYVAAAQVAVKKAGNFNARVAKDNPDPAAKADAAKSMAGDYRRGAQLYRKSADIEDRRAQELENAGRKPEAQLARDKAHNTRFVADRLDRQANEIEKGGVPGADAE